MFQDKEPPAHYILHVVMAAPRKQSRPLHERARAHAPVAVRVGQYVRLAALLLASFTLPELIVQAQTPASRSTPTQAAPPTLTPTDQPIPLPQVADRADQLERLLREISKQLTPAPDFVEAERTAKQKAEETRARELQAEKLLAGEPNGLELQNEARHWRSLSSLYAAQRKVLTARAADLESSILLLDSHKAQWQATLDQIHADVAIRPVIDRIRQELDAIRVTRSQAQEQLNLVLTLQNQVSQRDQRIADLLARLDEAQERMRGRLLARDSHPLWAARELRRLDPPMATVTRGSAGREFTNTADYLRAKKSRGVFIAILFVLGLLAAFKLKGYVGGAAWSGIPSEAPQIFGRPYSLAILVTLFGTLGQAVSTPPAVGVVIIVLYLIPALRLLPPLIEPGARPLLYTLAAFYLLQGTLLLVQIPPVLRREIFALLIFAALVAFARLTRPSRLRRMRIGKRQGLMTAAIRAGLALLAASLAANVFGFLSLAQILGGASLFGAFLGTALYSAYRVLVLILMTILWSKWARSVPDLHRQTIERWGRWALFAGGCLLWLNGVLYLFTIRDDVLAAISGVLQYPIGFDRVHFTLRGVLSLVLVLIVGFALAKGITLVLQRILLARMPLRRGLPYAISKVTYYILLVMVFLAALADSGVELNKFTVVTGALGVGVGFGLQNVVNNFVSGLILLFERPIRVGDIVEVGGLAGMVKRIGARSSTVQTAQDAEVIVPNSNLVSNQVINWTLSSPWRRVDIPVGVAYGTDPEPVLKLLVEVAQSHPGVRNDPKPSAFFLGFGESAMNFELRFWAAQDTWFQLKSDVSVGVAKALREAGVEVPFPQRDLHVRSIDASVKEALSTLPDRKTFD